MTDSTYGNSRGDSDIEALVALAREGDNAALDSVLRDAQRRVYGLALRFLWHPQDAEDATQDILIRIVTRLSTFRGESAFGTWVYRIATNVLLNLRKQRMERTALSFDEFADDLERGLQAPAPAAQDAERQLLYQEVRIGCSLGMLLCLDRPQRLAYILGEVLELDHGEAAAVLEITPAAYRQRLARARRRVSDFLQRKCGLFDPANPCRCHLRLETAISRGRVVPGKLRHATSLRNAREFPGLLAEIRRLEATARAAALYRAHPPVTAQFDFPAALRSLLAQHP